MKKSIYIAGFIIILLIAGIWYLSTRNSVTKKQISSGNKMTFFVTSVNPGQGANFGGLEGADNYCRTLALASTASVENLVWRAYLSTNATNSSPEVNARDRIGNGPWRNFNGNIIASTLEELHGINNINKQIALTEKGATVNGRGDTPNLHDILTGSDSQGRAIATSTDTTCGNWTSSTTGSAMLGHHDRLGISDTEAARSWNSSHLSRGCSLDALASTGGGGLFYCFAKTE